jgi:T-complex protein 1 subunit gamma
MGGILCVVCFSLCIIANLKGRLTNDGNAILREIDVAHPAAKNMIELSRTQDEECGDGTTSVIILGPSSIFPSFRHLLTFVAAGEILAQSLSQLERDIHPVVIIRAYTKALAEALAIVKSISIPIDPSSDKEMLSLIKTSIGTKFSARWSELMCKLALDAVRTVAVEAAKDGSNETLTTVDIKRYARVEKVPGGAIEDSRVLRGVMLNKDITHPAMRRRIVNPRIVLLDCPLEYKKGESQTNMEFSKENDWARAQEIEEEQVRALVMRILEFKPDLVITEKGVSGKDERFLTRFTSELIVCNRPRTTRLHAAQRLGAAPRTKVRQQPYRAGRWRDHRQPR